MFKAIRGYEDKYSVNRQGQVLSVKKNILLSPCINNGYRCVLLTNNHKRKLKYIHRLVAEAFIPNPDNLPCVNHKDENKLNNTVENLERCTWLYNNTYNGRSKRIADKMKGKPAWNRKPVIDLNTGNTYISVSEANKNIPIHYYRIKDMLEGRSDEYKGYRLRYL